MDKKILNRLNVSPLSKDETLEKAKVIFKQKRSKKELFIKLLQVLLDESIVEDNLLK